MNHPIRDYKKEIREAKKNKDLNKKGSAKPNRSFELLLSYHFSIKNSEPSGLNKSVKPLMVTPISGVYKYFREGHSLDGIKD